MELLQFTVVALLLMCGVALGAVQQQQLQGAQIQCYQCGTDQLCPFPWKADGVITVNCTSSCYKFDGYAADNTRVLMRDCGYFSTNECSDSQDLFGGQSAVGKVCHCDEGNLCNGKDSLAAMSWWTVVALTIGAARLH